MLFFNALLNPLATLSCHLQGHSADLPFTIANLDSVHLIFENLKVDNPEVPSELSQCIAAAEKDDQLHFQNVKLSGVQPNVPRLECIYDVKITFHQSYWEMHSQSF